MALLARFITKHKLTEGLPPIPSDIDKYVQQVCEIQLMAALDDMKSKYEVHNLKQSRQRNMEVTLHYLSKLKRLLQDTSSLDIQKVAKDLEPCSSPVITALRVGMARRRT